MTDIRCIFPLLRRGLESDDKVDLREKLRLANLEMKRETLRCKPKESKRESEHQGGPLCLQTLEEIKVPGEGSPDIEERIIDGGGDHKNEEPIWRDEERGGEGEKSESD